MNLDRLLSLAAIAQQQAQSSLDVLRASGLVVPSHEFFRKEDERYSTVFRHSYFQSARLSTYREALQNSLDAGATRFECDVLSFPGLQEAVPELKLRSNRMVQFKDDGTWVNQDSSLLPKILDYFLVMNGSRKSADKGQGGFGVGRFIILFNSPLWTLETGNVAIVGHYNCFKLVCRSCLDPTLSREKVACERPACRRAAWARGTSILTQHSATPDMQNCVDKYFRFCDLKQAELAVNGRPVRPVKTKGSPLLVTPDFRVSRLDCTSSDPASTEVMVRAPNGMLMFSRIIWDGTNPGSMVIDLQGSLAEQGYQAYDQSRQTFVGHYGDAFDKILEKLGRSNFRHDGDLDYKVEVSAVGEGKARGPFTCTYFFRDGFTMTGIEGRWTPTCTNRSHVRNAAFVLSLWRAVVEHAVSLMGDKIYSAVEYKVGFVFSKTVKAMLEGGKTFYINPTKLMDALSTSTPMQAPRSSIVSYMLAMAVHEATHLEFAEHDQNFASYMTDLTAQAVGPLLKRTAPLWKRVKRCRQEACDLKPMAKRLKR